MDTVTVRVQRRTGPDAKPRFQSFVVPVYPKMSVLDALFEIQRAHDRTLTFRCSCRVGMCGTCGMVIDKRERLACQTQISALGNTIEVQPLRNLPVVKDLACDMEPFFQRYISVLPFLIPTPEVEAAPAPLQIQQGIGERRFVDAAIGCILCGLCHSACTMVGCHPDFPGPASLNRAYSLVDDRRDAAGPERLARVTGSQGVWRCHTLFTCAEVCPRHLVPTEAITLLRRRGTARALGSTFRIWPLRMVGTVKS